MTLKEEKDLVKKIAVKDFRKFVLGRWDNAAHERAAIALQTRAAEEAKQHCHNEACERASATTHK